MEKTIYALISLLIIIGIPVCRAQNIQKKMAPYYTQVSSGYLRIVGDSVVSERKVTPENYVRDTLRAFYDYLWKPCAYKGLAAYFTYAVRAGDFWQCNDYYDRSKKEFRWGFFEDQQLTIPAGPFRQYYENGQVQNKGHYKNGRKTGLWEWFDEEGRFAGKTKYKEGVAIGYGFRVYDGDTVFLRLDSVGAGYSYKKLADGRMLFRGKYLAGGIKDSTWNDYDKQGRLWYTQQFRVGKLTGELCYDTTGAILTTDTAYQMAQFKKPVQEYLSNHVVFPGNLRLNIPSGKIVARFVVEEDGRVDKIKIVQSLEPHFDYQVVWALEHMPKWIPAKDHGRAVKSYYLAPFTFSNE